MTLYDVNSSLWQSSQALPYLKPSGRIKVTRENKEADRCGLTATFKVNTRGFSNFSRSQRFVGIVNCTVLKQSSMILSVLSPPRESHPSFIDCCGVSSLHLLSKCNPVINSKCSTIKQSARPQTSYFLRKHYLKPLVVRPKRSEVHHPGTKREIFKIAARYENNNSPALRPVVR